MSPPWGACWIACRLARFSTDRRKSSPANHSHLASMAVWIEGVRRTVFNAQRTKLTGGAATGVREIEGVYRRVRLNAWLAIAVTQRSRRSNEAQRADCDPRRKIVLL